jgi:hypothetical protein
VLLFSVQSFWHLEHRIKNHLHERFVTEYLTRARYNATQAYPTVFVCFRASAEVGGCRLRKRPEVAAEIDRRFKQQLAAIEGDLRASARAAVAHLLR